MPGVPSSVLAQQSNHWVPGPGPTVKLIGIMARTQEREKSNVSKRKANPHAIERN